MHEIAQAPAPALRRTALLWLHILCAGVAAFALLSRENLSLTYIFFGGSQTRGVGVAFAVLPVILPFLFSFLLCKRTIPTRASLTYLYTFTLLIGTVAAVWRIALANSLGGVLLVALALTVGLVVVASTMNACAQNRRDA